LPDPVPVPGLHLVKTTDPKEDALASDCIDILQEGLRGGIDGGSDGGVEPIDRTTLERDELAKTEHDFFQAIGQKLRERCSEWADGRKGLHVSEILTEKGGHGWRFGVFDREGRSFEAEVTFSELAEVAKMQQAATLSNFPAMLDRVVTRIEGARRHYYARRDGVTLS
jgi:hypothetical protein